MLVDEGMTIKPNPASALGYLPVPSLQPCLEHPNCLWRNRAALVIWSLVGAYGTHWKRSCVYLGRAREKSKISEARPELIRLQLSFCFWLHR